MYPGPNSPTMRGDESTSEVCTPPLVFTPHFVSAPPQYSESGGTPPMQPLQVCTNFNVHGSGPSMPRRESGQLLEVENSPIRVRARTRDGRHSPYLAPNPGAAQMDPETQGTYGFGYSGTSSPVAVSTPTGRMPLPTFTPPTDDLYGTDDAMQGGHPHQSYSLPHQSQGSQNQYYVGGGRPYTGGSPHLHHGQAQYSQPQQHTIVSEKVYSHSSLDPSFELPTQVVHRALKGRCRFIEFPANLPTPPTPAAGANATSHDDNGVALFIGQVRFETTPAELTWLVQRTCGAVASRLEGRGAGCYLLYCRSETDLQLIRGLHKRVLFDVGGAWLARTPEEVDALCEYVAIDAPLLSKKARLPRDSMVVEDLKIDAAPSHRGGGADTGAHGSGGRKAGHAHGGGGGGQHGRNNNNNKNGGDGHAHHQRHQQSSGGGQPWHSGNGANSIPSSAPPPPDYNYAGGAGSAPPPYNARSHTRATAIEELVASAMPAATVWMLDSAPDMVAGNSGEELLRSAAGGDQLLGAYLQHRKQLLMDRKVGVANAQGALVTPDRAAGLVTGVHALITSQPECTEPWRRLVQLCPPYQFSSVPGARPQCGPAAVPAFGVPTPLWTPHAVVHYGGYESGDLGRFLLTPILANVPVLQRVPSTENSSAAGPTAPQRSQSTVSQSRQSPGYVRQHVRHTTAELQARGCFLVDPDLMELSLVVRPANHDGVCRQRTFVAFASPTVTVAELNRETNAGRRQTLRTSFGYSFSTLRATLPVPLLLAASAMQAWHAQRTGAELCCAAPFWVSAVAHRWSTCATGEHMKVFEALRTTQQAGLRATSSDTTWAALHEALTSKEPAQLAASELRALATAVAASTAVDMHACSQTRWGDTYSRNFFLRNEDFAQCDDVAHLSRTRTDWSRAELRALTGLF